MPLTSTRRTHHTTAPRTTRTTRTKPSLKTRLMGAPRTGTRTSARRAPATTTTTTTTKTTRTTHGAGHHGATTTHHHKRHATMGDKVSGALMKLRGSLTRRPGLKAAGTRRMHGTDGRNARRVY
ncbi:hypothetical protein DPSP01_012064 [Paraphaeosphaeria sporulosa]|uniref:Uncharacterized protein n=1 Tax=Paraphaeosphaeria sporulosa TaxID=1460663 RepID=A0A177CJA1_9PLEO|nr:uncharacterized protein CC84DRAFT_1175385 [Paraphaeosphaeria sporulosa]OAG07614.1 hypothetical protein CC84DRAFT_1175385 [Paraphaeosphaeria sporulosa]